FMVPPSFALQLHVFIRAGPREPGDEPDPRLFYPRAQTRQAGVEPDGRDDHLLVDELLDAVQGRLAPLRVQLVRLLLEEAVDIGVAAVDVRAAPDDEGLDSSRGIAEGAAGAGDEPLVFLFGPSLEVGRPLDRAEPHADTGGVEIV